MTPTPTPTPTPNKQPIAWIITSIVTIIIIGLIIIFKILGVPNNILQMFFGPRGAQILSNIGSKISQSGRYIGEGAIKTKETAGKMKESIDPIEYKYLKISLILLLLIVPLFYFKYSNDQSKISDEKCKEILKYTTEDDIDDIPENDLPEGFLCCKNFEIYSILKIFSNIFDLILLFIIAIIHGCFIYGLNLNKYILSEKFITFIVGWCFMRIVLLFFGIAILGIKEKNEDKKEKKSLIHLLFIVIILLLVFLIYKFILNSNDGIYIYFIYSLFAIIFIHRYVDEKFNCVIPSPPPGSKTCNDYKCNNIFDTPWDEETAKMWKKCCPLENNCYSEKVDKAMEQSEEEINDFMKNDENDGMDLIREEAEYRVRKTKCNVDQMRQDIKDDIYA